MENSVEAIKFALAIFIFVIALTVILVALASAKGAADSAFWYADKTNFRDYHNDGSNIVGVDEVIATLFRYYKESMSVQILSRSGEIVAIFDTAIERECTWRNSNEDTIERIKVFVTGINTTDKVTFALDSNYYRDETNYTDGILKRGTTVTGTMSLPDLCGTVPGGNMLNARFEKTFVETTVDGIYHNPTNYGLEDDGTVIQITPGTKKVFITYRLCNN